MTARITRIYEESSAKDARWPEFQKRYKAELKKNSEVDTLRNFMKERKVVNLPYSARNEAENQAVVLLDYLG